MGGDGSGRLPSPETIAKKMEGVHEPKFFMPAGGIGGVKPEAKRSDSSVLLKSGDNVSLLANDVPYLTSAGAETDPVFLSLSGNYMLNTGDTATGNYFFDAMALSGNRVGIGTTSPNFKLDVSGNVNAQTLSGNAIRTTEDHSTSGNSAVVGIITHTSATPPTASNFPIGTIYVQYTN